MKLRTVLQTLLVVFITIMMFACESPEEKKMNAFNRGEAFYEKGKYAEAKLEFKNAIQVDPEFTEAYYKLGMAEFKQGKINPSFRIKKITPIITVSYFFKIFIMALLLFIF